MPQYFLNDILSRYIINMPVCERKMERIVFIFEVNIFKYLT